MKPHESGALDKRRNYGLLPNCFEVWLCGWDTDRTDRLKHRKNGRHVPDCAALIYRWDMGRSFTRRSCVLAWLLCALLICLAIHTPHCDLCDGPLVMQLSSSQPHASHPAPIVPDGCNGMCWCCAFLAVPSIAPGVIPEQRIATAIWPEPPSTVLDRSLSIDRPPRIAVSI
jgi:hypothetical protein